MKLHENYLHILKKSWAIKWAILAGVFSGAQIILPIFSTDIPKIPFAILSFIAVAGAIWSRLLVQKKDDL